MKYQLILQWPASSVEDYDAMISIEGSLIDELSDGSDVDGHDGGPGQVNIFIRTDSPTKTLEAAKKILENHGAWSDVKVAYREIERNEYTILWPKNLERFEVV